MKNTHFLALLFFSLLFYGKGSSATRYIKTTMSGLGDGSSWANAANDLQAIINSSSAGDEIWVAAGIYYTTLGLDRSVSFSLKNGVAIYGGFTGNETFRSDRNWTNNITVLSGDIGVMGSNIDNAYHVISNSGLNTTAVLDGFTISGGYANDSNEGKGGGVYNVSASPKIENCNIISNYGLRYGGGVSNVSGSAPSMINCTFSNNSSRLYGGGMYNENSSPICTNCTFNSNFLTHSGGGGGMYNRFNSSPFLTNCTFTGNSAYGGGGMCNEISSPTINACTFSLNQATYQGGGIKSYGSSPAINKSNFANNSAVEGGGIWTGAGSSPVISNCRISSNNATKGGGIMAYSSYPPSTIINCVIDNNTAQYGGGLYHWGTYNEVINCTLFQNSANVSGGGMYSDGYSGVTVKNSILWDYGTEIASDGTTTQTISHSIVQGPSVWPGIGNQNAVPLFVAPFDLQLQICSPAIDAGWDASNTNLTDFNGNIRKVDAIPGGQLIDIGAYEHQGAIAKTYYLDNDSDGYGNA